MKASGRQSTSDTEPGPFRRLSNFFDDQMMDHRTCKFFDQQTASPGQWTEFFDNHK